MKRALPIVALLASIFLACSATAQAVSSGSACRADASVSGVVSAGQNSDSTPVDLGMIGKPVNLATGTRIPFCGDYCDVEGQGGGCVYYGSGGKLVRVTAICQNGVWTPYP